MDIIVVAERYAIRFPLEEAPEYSRLARGARAIKLREADIVVGAVVVPNDGSGHVVFVTNTGNIKKVKVSEFPQQKRDGMGVRVLDEKTEEKIVAVAFAQ